MALTKRKQAAIDAVKVAEKRLAAHYGVGGLRKVYSDPDRYTIRALNRLAESLTKKLDEPIPEASEKQLNFIKKLLDKPFNAHAKVELGDARPNKHQASELINNLLTTEDWIHSRYDISAAAFEQQDEELSEIIERIKKNF